MPENSSRRTFLKTATAAIAGVIGVVTSVPLLRYLLFPVGRKVVDSAEVPVDVIGADALKPGGDPVRVTIRAEDVRDAWRVADQVPLGAAWVQKSQDGRVTALSTACPHLGCAVDFSEGEYRCPCHKSAFALNGDKKSGPSKRGLDPLPVKVEEGRVKVTYIRFRPDVPGREKA